jgi:uncharacterized protein YecE (DUF72 family)
MDMIHIGIAGWSNPPQERMNRAAGLSHLQHYAERFNAVEINTSFYRRHKQSTYARWSESTPAGFRFSVKVPRSVTHDCALRSCRKELTQFLLEISGLGPKLGVILVQTPASLAFDARSANRFFASLCCAAPCRVVCEPRHPSWFSPRAASTLARYGVARVAADPAKVAAAAEPGGAADLVYFRLHGSPRMYYSAYSCAYLRELRLKIRTQSGAEAWCIFDNTARHASWDNALQLRSGFSGVPAA